jgi:hypothetical protein
LPVYEFVCVKGHTTSDLVPVGQKSVLCAVCISEMRIAHERNPDSIGAWNAVATRVLSPTPTTFRFADVRRGR